MRARNGFFDQHFTARHLACYDFNKAQEETMFRGRQCQTGYERDETEIKINRQRLGIENNRKENMTDEQFEKFMAVQVAQLAMFQGIYRTVQAIASDSKRPATHNWKDLASDLEEGLRVVRNIK
ncbi:MAG: hypothetical protein M3Y65_17085 [Pseudomonadota bacterium]|nr:hypothetical protein [Pseudomonadota bacterium]